MINPKYTHMMYYLQEYLAVVVMCSCSTKGWASLVIKAEAEEEVAEKSEAEVTGKSMV